MRNLSDMSLMEKLKNLVGEERKVTALILDYLGEVDTRRLYLEWGHPSLFEFCLKELGYSESSAFRRISSMRMIKNLPEVREKIISGTLTLSVVAQAQSFFKKQEMRGMKPGDRASKENVSGKDSEKDSTKNTVNLYGFRENKLNLLKSLENKSSRACEMLLLELAPEVVREDKVRAITPKLTELRLTVDQNFMDALEKLKNLLSHSRPNLSTQEILKLALDQMLIEKDPSLKPQTSKNSKPSKKLNSDRTPSALEMKSSETLATSTSLPTSVRPVPSCIRREVESKRYVPAEIKRTLWFQSCSKCSYQSPITGKVCGSKKFLEIDHKIPFSKGGPTKLENLQLLCDQHNRRKGDQIS